MRTEPHSTLVCCDPSDTRHTCSALSTEAVTMRSSSLRNAPPITCIRWPRSTVYGDEGHSRPCEGTDQSDADLPPHESSSFPDGLNATHET